MPENKVKMNFNDDGLCTAGAPGMTPEKVVAKYPKIALMLLQEQYDIITNLRKDVERLKESRVR